MDSVFLSYTFSPRTDFASQQDDLLKRVRTVLESMDLREVNGEDLGGEALTPEVKKRIDSADALVCLVMPHSKSTDQLQASQWVLDEYTYAMARGKRVIRFIFKDIPAMGMSANNEFIAYDPARQVDCLTKLMRTLSLWIAKGGRPARFVVTGDQLAAFDSEKGHVCEYRIRNEREEFGWQGATLWRDTGAMYAYVSGFPKDHRLKLKITMGSTVLETDYQGGYGQFGFDGSAP